MSVIIIIIPLILIASRPSIIIIYITNSWLKNYKIPPKTFVIVSMFLAMATAINLKLEFENGLYSLPLQLAVLSSIWVLFFILTFLCYKSVWNNKNT